MYRIVYMSRAPGHMSDQALDQICKTATINNARREVTGILLYVGDTFFQVLEGARVEVEATYDRVFMDERHCRVRIMFADTVKERRFSNWSMGFCRLSEQDGDAAAFFELSRAGFEDRIPEGAGEELIKLMAGFSKSKLTAAEPLLFDN